MKVSSRRGVGCMIALCLLALPVYGESYSIEDPVDPFATIGDVSDDESKLMLKKRDFIVVPIPISDPTLGTGLILGGAYFYSQTEEQKKSQPASLTGIAGVYTSSDSFAYGITQQNYWGGDKWRFNGTAGHIDFKLKLLDPVNTNNNIDWALKGNFVQAALSRRVAPSWYVGVQGRYVDNTQGFSVDLEDIGFDIKTDLTSVGLGVTLEFDTRDIPTNPYRGRHFELKALFNSELSGSDDNYQTYEGSYQSYHQVLDPLVLAWEIKACRKSGLVPLWDSCRIPLRGFPATNYLGVSSLSGQAEARWRFWKKWGAVGFAGYGASRKSFSETGGNVSVPSYGVGLRWMVLQSKRINMRLDYARSTDSDAWYLSATEAF